MSADDTSFFVQDRLLTNLINTGNVDLQNIENWLSSNKLSVNNDKTNFIIFETKPSKQEFNQLHLSLRNKCIKK